MPADQPSVADGPFRFYSLYIFLLHFIRQAAIRGAIISHHTAPMDPNYPNIPSGISSVIRELYEDTVPPNLHDLPHRMLDSVDKLMGEICELHVLRWLIR
jgi:hypothetical protein